MKFMYSLLAVLALASPGYAQTQPANWNLMSADAQAAWVAAHPPPNQPVFTIASLPVRLTRTADGSEQFALRDKRATPMILVWVHEMPETNTSEVRIRETLLRAKTTTVRLSKSIDALVSPGEVFPVPLRSCVRNQVQSDLENTVTYIFICLETGVRVTSQTYGGVGRPDKIASNLAFFIDSGTALDLFLRQLGTEAVHVRFD